jgi:hypothetical protein
VNGELQKKYKHFIYKRNIYSYSVFTTEENITYKILEAYKKGKGKGFPLQALCGPEGGQRYSSTLP